MTVGRPLSNYKAIIVLVIAIILLAAAGFFLFERNTNSSSGPTESKNTPAAKNNKLVIKDLGVEITLPDDLVGTTVETSTPPPPPKSNIKPAPIVNFIIDRYSNEVSGCVGAKYAYKTPYASLSKISGQAPANDTLLMKQLEGFHIDRLSDGLKLTCKDQSMQTAFDNMTRQYNKDLKDAFSSAQLIK